MSETYTTLDATGLLTRVYDRERLKKETYTEVGLLTGRVLARTLDAQLRVDGLATDSGYAVGYTAPGCRRRVQRGLKIGVVLKKGVVPLFVVFRVRELPLSLRITGLLTSARKGRRFFPPDLCVRAPTWLRGQSPKSYDTAARAVNTLRK